MDLASVSLLLLLLSITAPPRDSTLSGRPRDMDEPEGSRDFSSWSSLVSEVSLAGWRLQDWGTGMDHPGW